MMSNNLEFSDERHLYAEEERSSEYNGLESGEVVIIGVVVVDDDDGVVDDVDGDVDDGVVDVLVNCNTIPAMVTMIICHECSGCSGCSG